MYYIVDNWHIVKCFPTLRGAKISMRRRYRMKYPEATIMDSVVFKRDEPLVETRNLMTGETIMIPASQKDTCCDPARELYWQM